MSVHEKLKSLGITLPPVSVPAAAYVPYVQTGKLVWKHDSQKELTGGPGAGDGLVVVGGLDGEVIALDAATGEEKWQAKVTAEVVAPPAVGQGLVFIRSNDGRVTALDAASGERRWFWNHDLPTLTVRGNDAPTLGPGVVFVGNDDGTISTLAMGLAARAASGDSRNTTASGTGLPLSSTTWTCNAAAQPSRGRQATMAANRATQRARLERCVTARWPCQATAPRWPPCPPVWPGR